ncbi:MAG: hypothetical protein ACJ77B_10715 [Chloroflexota bacterium]
MELSLREGNWAARRKSWNVVVRGWFEVERAGLIFVGTADVADEQALQRIVALLRVGAATPLALALGLALARPDGVAAASIAFGAALAGVSLVGITRLVADGERQALADAGRLISLLERDLG